MKKIVKKAYKYRLKPTKEQAQSFAHNAGCARYVYNYALELIKSSLRARGKIISYHDLAGELPFLKRGSETSWLKEAHSQVLQQSMMDLYKGLERYFQSKKAEGRVGFPTFKSKGKNDSFRYPQEVKVEDGKVYLPKIGWVKYRNSRPVEGVVKQATIRKEAGYWNISIHCEVETEFEPAVINEANSVGLDMGLDAYIATSDGERIPNPAYLSKLLSQLRALSKELSRKKKYSKNWKKCVAKIQRLHARIANLRKDFLHKLSTNITKNHGVVCVESLNIKGMVQNRRLSRSISDAGWGMFLTFLNYKCDWAGKHFVEVDRFFPSSKLCYHCGAKQEMPLSKRVYKCDCGVEIDRDVNAAKNIRVAGMSILKACGEIDISQLDEARILGF